MSPKKYSFFLYLLSIMLILFIAIGCSEDSSQTTSPTNPDKVTGLPSDPGPGNLAGKVIGTIQGQPLAGVTVSANSRSTTTASDGTFLLSGVGEGIFAVIISGNALYVRTVVVNTANGRSVSIDAIETNSNFNLKFYREIARGNHPLERDLFPTHRWVNPTPPTFYINTNAQAALDGVIDGKTIDTVGRVLKEVIPVFTGNVYSSIQVETAFFPATLDFSQLPENSFIIAFDDSLKNIGAYGMTYTEPDFISPTTRTINKTVIYLLDNELFYKSGNPANISFEEIIAHEAGHGMGFRHTSESSFAGTPSVMVKTGEFGGIYSYADALHMPIVYRRPAGNTDVDNDPVPRAKLRGLVSKPQVFVDERAGSAVSPEIQSQLEALEGFAMVRGYIAEYY